MLSDSEEVLFSPNAGSTEDQLAVVASAQKLVEANEKVLDQLEERACHEQKLEEAVIELQKQNACILKSLQELKRTSNLSQSSNSRVQKHINRDVSLQVRGVYKDLIQSQSDFNGWKFTPNYKFADAVNQAVTQKVTNEVLGQYPNFARGEIRESCYRYFITLKQREHRSDKLDSDKHKQRRLQRRYRKRDRRLKAARKVLKNDAARLEKWEKVINIDFMSSEDSCSDEDSDDEPTFLLKPLPWRSEKVNNFFGTLDEAAKTISSKQSKKMRYSRSKSTASKRRCPLHRYKDCLWTIKHQYHPVQQQEQP